MTIRLSRTLAAAIAMCAAGTTLAIAPAASATPAHSRSVLVNCAGKATVKPKRFTIACADGNDYLARLKWSHWRATANGRGNDWINSCNPTCVAGKFHKFRARVRLWRPRARPHHPGQRYFTRMTLTYTHAVPKGYHRRRTIRLWAKA
ncbi:MAG TPA: hypothetical protein VMA95_07300 [Streptosporangiaceae bacterium]|nr:hypothetical protein [Streptosporangiaceae bacterium]